MWTNPVVLSEQDPEQVADPWWRLTHLYWIQDENGLLVPFRPNWAQTRLYRELHTLNLILKARQLGFTTFIQILQLDQALFRPGLHCGTIAHTNESVEDIFDNKIMFVYAHLPEDLKAAIRPDTKNAKHLKLSNGSSLRVARSFRGSTMQMLHVSEYGIICFESPDKAAEIRTGALRTVHQGHYIFLESTAKGSSGDFFDRCQIARRNTELAAQGVTRLTSMDYKFHFFPWFNDHRYRLDEHVVFSEDDQTYFEKVEVDAGITLDSAQRAWYVKQRDTSSSQEELRNEYPSTPEEAFEASNEGRVFAKQVTATRVDGRIAKLPVERGVPVNTFWDLGFNDINAIWFHQRVGPWDHFIRYFESANEDITFYIEVLDDLYKRYEYQWGTVYLPHDGKTRHVTALAGSARDILVRDGFDVRVIDRPLRKNVSIEATRRAFKHCRFDAEACKQGLAYLEMYQYEWNPMLQTYAKSPKHDKSSNCADAFQTYGFGYSENDAARDALYDSGGRAVLWRRRYGSALRPSTRHVV